MGTYTYHIWTAFELLKVNNINKYRPNHYYHVKDHYQISLPTYFHHILTPTTALLMQPNVQLLFVVDDHDNKTRRCRIGGRFACEPFQTASEDAIERGRAGANDFGVVSAVGRARRPSQPRPSARRQISMAWRAIWRRARIAALQRLRSPDRNDEAVRGWPCMSANGPQRSHGWTVGWGAAHSSFRRGGEGDVMVIEFLFDISRGRT